MAAFLLPILSQIYTDGPGEALKAMKVTVFKFLLGKIKIFLFLYLRCFVCICL